MLDAISFLPIRPTHWPLSWVLFTYTLMVLASFSVTRLITTDVWPPTADLRRLLVRKSGPRWGEAWTCPWCMGWWVSLIIFFSTYLFRPMPLPVLQLISIRVIVGYLGTYDSRE